VRENKTKTVGGEAIGKKFDDSRTERQTDRQTDTHQSSIL